MRCLHSGSLSESGCLRKMGGKFQYRSPREAAPSQMETYRDSPRFHWSPALNLETLWFHKRAAHVGSRRNSPPSSGAKRDLLHSQYPSKTRSSLPSEYKPQYCHWLVLVLHPLFWLASQVFTTTFEPCDATAAALPLRSPLSFWRYGCFSRGANSAEAAFSWPKPMDHDSSVSPFSPEGKTANSFLVLT